MFKSENVRKLIKILLVICLIFCIVLLSFTLVNCGDSLPSGKASRIDFASGWNLTEAATFEYVNENTVKIKRLSDGQVFYMPDSSIEKIWVAD